MEETQDASSRNLNAVDVAPHRLGRHATRQLKIAAARFMLPIQSITRSQADILEELEEQTLDDRQREGSPVVPSMERM